MEEFQQKIYNTRLSGETTHPKSLWKVKYKDVALGFLSFSTTHGLNPHISNAAGKLKLAVWIVLFCFGLSGLAFHFYLITSSYLAYEVLVKTSISHVTQMNFPAVTICNLNPIKSSMLSNSPELEALVNSWGSDNRRRRKRDTNAHSRHRTRRSVTRPSLTNCPSEAQFYYGEYCYVVNTDGATWDSAQSQCQSNNGHLVWYDDEAEHEVVNQMFCQVDVCSGVRRYWTGLYDTVGDNNVGDYKYTWGGSPSFYNWQSSEPSSNTNDCVENRRTFGTFIWEWNDKSCSTLTDFICKYRYAARTDNSTTQHQVTACENTTMELTCPEDTTIHVVSVFYGRDNSSTCDNSTLDTSTTDCTCDTGDGAGGCFLNVLESCENEDTCETEASTAYMGVDPCSGVSKYVRITYECWGLNISVEEETTIAPTTPLSSSAIEETTLGVTTPAATSVYESSAIEETTLGVTTPAATSMYEEREPYREDFLQEEDLLRTLAEIPIEQKQRMGYNLTEIVGDCTFQGEACDMRDFVSFFHGVYGNCYAFNSGWNSEKVMKNSKTGRETGLRLVVKLGQEDYIPHVGETAGAVVVVHPQERFPFPEDEGIFALPGHINSIGTREVKVQRLGGNYGTCTDTSKSQSAINVFEEWFPKTKYSRSSCFKTCYQKNVIKRCECADSAFPRSGEALGVRNSTVCDTRNIDQDDCVYGVSVDFINGELNCKCENPCMEKYYRYYLSKSFWPSEAHADSFLETYADAVRSYENFTDDPEFFRRNFLVVEIFFDSLQLESLVESSKYPLIVYASDIGSIVGLWLGLTIFSAMEFLELCCDVIILSLTKVFHWSRLKTKNKENIIQSMQRSNSQMNDVNFGMINGKDSPAPLHRRPIHQGRREKSVVSTEEIYADASPTRENPIKPKVFLSRRLSMAKRSTRKVSPQRVA